MIEVLLNGLIAVPAGFALLVALAARHERLAVALAVVGAFATFGWSIWLAAEYDGRLGGSGSTVDLVWLSALDIQSEYLAKALKYAETKDLSPQEHEFLNQSARKIMRKGVLTSVPTNSISPNSTRNGRRTNAKRKKVRSAGIRSFRITPPVAPERITSGPS